MAYQIMISEQQRLALLTALRAAHVGTDADDNDPLQYWLSMLERLPAENAPNMLHGFCL